MLGLATASSASVSQYVPESLDALVAIIPTVPGHISARGVFVRISTRTEADAGIVWAAVVLVIAANSNPHHRHAAVRLGIEAFPVTVRLQGWTGHQSFPGRAAELGSAVLAVGDEIVQRWARGGEGQEPRLAVDLHTEANFVEGLWVGRQFGLLVVKSARTRSNIVWLGVFPQLGVILECLLKKTKKDNLYIINHVTRDRVWCCVTTSLRCTSECDMTAAIVIFSESTVGCSVIIVLRDNDSSLVLHDALVTLLPSIFMTIANPPDPHPGISVMWQYTEVSPPAKSSSYVLLSLAEKQKQRRIQRNAKGTSYCK